jgi:hydrocephalus-inducing protein
MQTQSHTDGLAGNNVLSQRDMTFIVSPPNLTFNRFVPHQTYEAKITFKNQTKETKDLRVLKPESRFFKISPPKGAANTLKVAAGLSITYIVYFTPEADTDYECDLTVHTDQERFTVPVRATGSRGHLTLPDVVHFPDAPIKATSRTTVLLTNTGTKPCKFKASTVAPFAVQPPFGMIEPHANMQIAVEFTPTAMTRYESTVVFDLGQGDTQAMRVTGDCAAVQIQMSTDCLTIPKTFISLERQGIVKVTNNSDSTVRYSWKNNETEEQDHELRQRMSRNDGLQRKLFASSAPGGTRGQAAHDHRATASGGGRRGSLGLTAAGVPASERPFLFDNDVFTIEPIEGAIPAKGSREFVVTFNPQLATQYFATAHLDIQGVRDRIPLAIKGTGLGPQCALSFDSLDLGDIFINSVHQYEVMLENRGSIEAKYALMPQQTLFGPKFKFTPQSGTIAAGSTQPLSISFCSDIIGIVSETFKIHVSGSGNELELHFKGRVIGPTFHFDVEEIDYGNVSYNFYHRKEFQLINTSEIPMRFHLRVPEDGQHARKEFEVIPATGSILPHGKQKIAVEFCSNTVQEYNAHLVVDIDEVGDNLDSLPIKATCIVPDIVVSRDALDFGHCFVGYPYSLDVELRNDTALSAKYEFILPAEDDPIRKKAEIVVGSGDVKERKGIVGARSTQRLKITLTAKMIGNVHLPLFVRILGSERAPHHIAISAKVTGPKIDVQPKSLDFGSVEVLTETIKPIVITNDSPIAATFTARLNTKHPPNVQPPFTLKQTEGTIKAHSTAHLHVIANLDEAMKFTDELVLTVQNNQETEIIALTATGRGFTLVPDIPMDLVEFGDLFTTVPVKKTFTLRNRGRKPQQIQWANERGKVKEGDAPVVFNITPERATINGKSEETFTIEGLSQVKGIFTEKFSCKLSQSHKLVFKATVQGNFQPPLLQYSTNQLAFNYVYSSEGPPSFVSSRPLTMKNVSPLDLHFSLKINKSATEASPFSIDQQDFELKKGESSVVNISFDAAYRGDRETHKTSTKMQVCFINHGQRDTITLTGDLQFPNLQLDTKDVDFGCILNDTEQRRVVTITNSSKVAAAYTWVFEDDQPEPISARTRKSEKDKEGIVAVPVNNVFDLIPFRGVIAPGSSERVEVLFNGLPGRKFNATAVCQVEGGPDYPLQLVGEASSIQYKFDRVVLDFGSQEYDTWQEKELILSNGGRVPFNYQVDLSCLSRPGMVEVSPLSGLVKDKARIVVRFSPRVPDRVDDHFRIQVAHFEPQLINVKGMGLYSSVVIGSVGNVNCVSRDDPPNFKPYLLEAKTRSMPQHDSKPSSKQGDAVVDPVLAEAERLYFRDIITEDAMIMKTTGKTSEELMSDSGDRTSQIKRKTFSGEWKYILSRYILDLGNVVKGDSKKRSFKVINTSTTAITFSVDRRHLATTGVTLTPDKYPKLAAMGSLVIEVALNTRTKGINVGDYSCEVLLDIKGGPLVLLDVRAHIIVPAVELSTDRLDFGKVQVGLTRIISVSLSNSQGLPCEWSAASAEEATGKQAKKAPEKRGRFVCTPDRGVLQPNQSALVEVAFIPTVSEQLHQKIGIRVASNPKIFELNCSGVGEELDLEVQPPAFDLPPVFPHQNSRQTFQLVNHSSVPVEVYSLNFDKKYLIEEDILLHAEELFTKDVLLLPPREVGASLPDHLMEAYYAKLLDADKNFVAADLLPQGDDGAKAMDLEKPPTVQPSIPLPPLEPLLDDGDAPKASVTVLTGPPLSGKTTLARMMADRYRVSPMSIDATLKVAMEFDTLEGAQLRSLLQRAGDLEAGKSLDVPVALLATVFKHRLKAADAHIGVVVDDLRCCITNNPEVLLEALKEAAAQAGCVFGAVSLTMDTELISLREAAIRVDRAQTDLDEATVTPLPEDEYDRLDEPGRRQHDMELKHFRDCKKRLQKATQEMQRIKQARVERAQQKRPSLLHEEVDKELQEAKEAEETQKKKPVAGKKGQQEAPPPPPKWDDLDAMQRYRRLYGHMKTNLDDATFHVLPCDLTKEEALKKLTDMVPFAALAAESVATVERERLEAAKQAVTVPAPLNRQRIERPPERRSINAARYFKILTPDTRAQTAPQGLDPKAPAGTQRQQSRPYPRRGHRLRPSRRRPSSGSRRRAGSSSRRAPWISRCSSAATRSRTSRRSCASASSVPRRNSR